MTATAPTHRNIKTGKEIRVGMGHSWQAVDTKTGETVTVFAYFVIKNGKTSGGSQTIRLAKLNKEYVAL